MMKQSVYCSVASISLLMSACATGGTSVAQGSDEETIISIDAVDRTASTDGTSTDDLSYKLLGMPDEIVGDTALLAWPGSGVAVAFEGSQLLATINGNSDTYLDVQINDVATTIQLNDGRFTYRLIDTVQGSYDVSLRIRTERPYRPIVFEGFTSDDGTMTKPARSDLQLLVVGDDVAAGYGIEGEDQFCTYSRETQNANLSFASLAAADLKADVATIARSGRGLTKNWDGNPAPNMAEFYERTMDTDAPTLLGPMDAVIVQLGGMDIAQEDLDADFKTDYSNFLSEIRGDHPDAEIVAAWGPMGSGDRYAAAKTAITEAVADRTASGDNKVSFIEFTNTEFGQLYGCNWHPSADTQRFMASRLVDHLADRLEINVDLDDLLLGG